MDSRQASISFDRTQNPAEGEIFAAFGSWLDLFNEQPHKVLPFNSLYDATEQIISRKSIVTAGEPLNKYFTYAEKDVRPFAHITGKSLTRQADVSAKQPAGLNIKNREKNNFSYQDLAPENRLNKGRCIFKSTRV